MIARDQIYEVVFFFFFFFAAERVCRYRFVITGRCVPSIYLYTRPSVFIRRFDFPDDFEIIYRSLWRHLQIARGYKN